MFREYFMSPFGIAIYNEMNDASKWINDHYWLMHKKSKVRFWVANGAMFFKAESLDTKPVDIEFGFFERRILWKRYKQMIKNEQIKIFNETIDKFKDSIQDDTKSNL